MFAGGLDGRDGALLLSRDAEELLGAALALDAGHVQMIAQQQKECFVANKLAWP